MAAECNPSNQCIHNFYNLALYSDSNGLPGAAIASSSGGFAAGAAVQILNMGPVTLSAGTTYWLVMSAGMSGTFTYWLRGGSPPEPAAYIYYNRFLGRNDNLPEMHEPPRWLPAGTSSLQFEIDGVPASRQPSYVPISIPGFDTYPFSINAAGTVVGSFANSPNSFHGFVRDAAGAITQFDAPNSVWTYAPSINAFGAITGYYLAVTGPVVHGFVRDPAGNPTSFDAPDATRTYSQSINAGGAVTGYYYEPSGFAHGFLRDADGTITSFDPPGAAGSGAFPVTINNAGAIAGYYQNASGFHGFVRDPSGNITSFDPPGSTRTSVLSINYAGAITGSYIGASGRSYGFVRDAAGTITSFDPGTYTQPASINSNGVIAGRYFKDSQFTTGSGFLRSPGGTITLLDLPNFCTGYVSPTSINEGGVITGTCPGSSVVGFVRFP
jgi:hypothetical protein